MHFKTDIQLAYIAPEELPPFTQPRTRQPPAILTQSMGPDAEQSPPREYSPVDPPAITTPSNAAMRVIERAATRAVEAGSDRIGHKIKYKATSAAGLLTTQLEQARKVKSMQNSARRALGGGKGKRRGAKKTEEEEIKTILIILKSAVIDRSDECFLWDGKKSTSIRYLHLDILTETPSNVRKDTDVYRGKVSDTYKISG